MSVRLENDRAVGFVGVLVCLPIVSVLRNMTHIQVKVDLHSQHFRLSKSFFCVLDFLSKISLRRSDKIQFVPPSKILADQISNLE